MEPFHGGGFSLCYSIDARVHALGGAVGEIEDDRAVPEHLRDGGHFEQIGELVRGGEVVVVGADLAGPHDVARTGEMGAAL